MEDDEIDEEALLYGDVGASIVLSIESPIESITRDLARSRARSPATARARTDGCFLPSQTTSATQG